MKSRSRVSAPTTVKRTVPHDRLSKAEYRTRDRVTTIEDGCTNHTHFSTLVQVRFGACSRPTNRCSDRASPDKEVFLCLREAIRFECSGFGEDLSALGDVSPLTEPPRLSAPVARRTRRAPATAASPARERGFRLGPSRLPSLPRGVDGGLHEPQC